MNTDKHRSGEEAIEQKTALALPPGSYAESCRNERIEVHDDGQQWLVAECRRCNGEWVESRLQLKEISNNDGRLQYPFETSVYEAWNEAIETGNEDHAALLLRAIPQLATTGVIRTRRNGTTFELPPIHVANNKSLSIVKLLVEAGADSSPGLPWYGAAPEVLEYLLSENPNVDGREMLVEDAYAAKFENVKRYLQHGTPPEPWPELESNCSPLHAACFYSQRMRGFGLEDGFDADAFRKTVKALLNGGADVHARMAIEKPCDIGPISIHAETPLHYAAGGGDVEIVRMLLDAGADPNATNSLGETPTDWSKKYHGNEEVERLLTHK